MGISDKWPFKRARAEPEPIPTGRITSTGSGFYKSSTLSPYRSRTSDVLETLRMIPDEVEALDFLRRTTPDISMALWNFVRLANQGHEMKFNDLNGKRMESVEKQWREFASRVNQVSNAGLDGLIDVLHYSAYMRCAQGLEVEVNTDRTDIVDVYPVIPQTIMWELEKRNGREVWIPYQQQMAKKVSLEPGKANFFWVPTDPDIDDPRGNLVMSSVLQSIDFQMQIMQDLQAVLHRQGWPRNDISIDLERMVNSMPPSVRNGTEGKRQEWLMNRFNEIRNAMDSLNPDSDYLHFDDITINMNQGANAARSLDVRAVTELVDVQVMNGGKQMGIFSNRTSGITETWGTVQFRIFCSGIASIQRGSKRLIEEVARLWLRVHGIQAVPKFSHNLIDWESEGQRMTVRLLEEEFHAIAQLMGWQDGDDAASAVLGKTSAVGEPIEGARVSFGKGGDSRDATDEQLPGELRRGESKRSRSRLEVI